MTVIPSRLGPILALLLIVPCLAWTQEPDPVSSTRSDDGQPTRIIMLPRSLEEAKAFVQQTGFMIYPIGLCALAVVAIVLERLVSLRRRRVLQPALTRRLVRDLRDEALDRKSAMRLCRDQRGPMASLALSAFRHWGASPAEIESAVKDAGQREIGLLRRNVRSLSSVANLATLLGLLGTVQGMIIAFNKVASAKGLGRADILADGIAQALLTTACGLVVAIPALFFHGWFVSKIERLVYEMDEWTSMITDEIAGPVARKVRIRKTRSRREPTPELEPEPAAVEE